MNHPLTFKQFLAEARRPDRTSQLDPEEAVSLVGQHCDEYAKKMLGAGFNIFRGGSGHSNWTAVLGDSDAGEPRKSANTANYFTLWHDNRPEWAAFPERSRSFICSSAVETADGYGIVRVLIPFDGSKIGVLPDDDLFASFPALDGDLGYFNDRVTVWFRALGIELPTTYQELVEALGQLTLEAVQKLEGEMHPGAHADMVRLIKHAGGSLLDVYKTVFVPGKDFKHYTTSDAKPLPVNREVYVQGKAVLIELSALEKKNGLFQALIDRYGWSF